MWCLKGLTARRAARLVAMLGGELSSFAWKDGELRLIPCEKARSLVAHILLGISCRSLSYIEKNEK